MRVYIIHAPNNSENYIDRVLTTEKKLIAQGHHIVNPLPDRTDIRPKELHEMYKGKIVLCDYVYAMDGWDKSAFGNLEMAKTMIHKKTICFEQ